MRPRTLVATFRTGESLLEAARAARGQGWRIRDAYTPYHVHGLDEVMGLGRSRLPAVCLVCGATGVGLALWFQWWASARDWPLNVGGRPWNSLPAFVPVAFEAMVLLGALGLVAAWLLVSRLYPGKAPVPHLPKTSDDAFALVVEDGS